jgi:hypothetical protein
MLYDTPTRVFLLKTYYKTGSPKLVQQAFRTKYESKHIPSRSVITNIVSSFEKYGSVVGTTKNGRPRSKKREEVKNQLETMISEDPSLSTRKAASALQCSQTFIVTVLHDDLHLKPFKFHNWHFIEEHDYAKRLEFAQWFLKLRKSTEQFMIFSDEAYFYLTLPNNKQNNRYWDVSANGYGIEVPLHDKKVFWFGAQFRLLMCLDHTFLTPRLTAPITWKCSGPILFPEWTRLKITEKVTSNKMEQEPTRLRWSKPTSPSDLGQDSLTKQCGHLALRTSIPVIFFMGLFEAESLQSIAKNFGGSPDEHRERSEKHSTDDAERYIFEFSKKVRIIDFRWWRPY